MILVNITQVAYSNVGGTGSFVVFLKGAEDERTLLIMIGRAEAESIALFLEKLEPPRPLTHDLFKNVLDNMECRMKRVIVRELKDDIFYATMIMERDGIEAEIDSRPSDAIALALRFGAPVYVVDEVMDKAGLVIPVEQKTVAPEQQKKDSKASRVESLNKQIQKAIEDERYEDAAKLRDEIAKLTTSN